MEVMLTFQAKHRKKKKTFTNIKHLVLTRNIVHPQRKTKWVISIVIWRMWGVTTGFHEALKKRKNKLREQHQGWTKFLHRRKVLQVQSKDSRLKCEAADFLKLLFIYLFGGQSKVLFSSQTENYTSDQRKRDRVGTLCYNKTGWFFFPFYFSLVLINWARHADVLLRLEHLRMLSGMNSLEIYCKASLLW